MEGLYTSIPHNAGLVALKDAIDCRQNKKMPTDMLIQIVEFVLTNNYSQFLQMVFHQIPGSTIGTKFPTSCACIFMDKFETDFLKTQKLQPFVRFRYIDDEFLYGFMVKRNLKDL